MPDCALLQLLQRSISYPAEGDRLPAGSRPYPFTQSMAFKESCFPAKVPGSKCSMPDQHGKQAQRAAAMCKNKKLLWAILAHKPWPHLSLSCYGELDAWTHINTIASNSIFRRSKTQVKDSDQRQGALTLTIRTTYVLQYSLVMHVPNIFTNTAPNQRRHNWEEKKLLIWLFYSLGLTKSNKDCSYV